MQPVDPRQGALAPNWDRVIYAKDQPEYQPLPALQERPFVAGDARGAPQRVVSVWEPDDTELAVLMTLVDAYRSGSMVRPQISLMLHTFGAPLQPIRLVVGSFEEPYEAQPTHAAGGVQLPPMAPASEG